MVPPGFGVRQPSGAFGRDDIDPMLESGRGLPHSKPLARISEPQSDFRPLRLRDGILLGLLAGRV